MTDDNEHDEPAGDEPHTGDPAAEAGPGIPVDELADVPGEPDTQNVTAPAEPDDDAAAGNDDDASGLPQPVALDADGFGDALPPPPQSAVSVRAQTILDPLRVWSERWGATKDPYVVGLSGTISGGASLSLWANLDPTVMLPEPTVKSGHLWRRLGRILLICRNVAVFIPVALTWLAINKATDAFALYSRDPLNAGRELNFLVFWQSGGEDGSYLSHFWRIDQIALLDAAIISFIVIATLLASPLEARARAKHQHSMHEAERERTTMALQIGAALQGHRTADPESITEALALSLNGLSGAARDVSNAAARMEAATGGVTALAPRLAELTHHVETLSNRFANDVTRAVDSLATSVGSLGVTMGGDMHRFLTDVLAGLEEVAERLGSTSIAVEFGTKQLRDDLDAVHSRLEKLTGRV